jgi:hypothetical protein
MSSLQGIYGVCHKERPKTKVKILRKTLLVGTVEYLMSQKKPKVRE